MKIGCFALVQPFTPMKRQFELLREMGIEYADITDNHNGGMLGVEYGFTPTVSLDSHPRRIREMAEGAGIQLTSFCAHANLLDPPGPDVYGTSEIIKAVRLAHELGIHHVITTEGDPKTEFGHGLTPEERIFAVLERLYWPVQWAEDLGVKLLLEPHGIVTGSVEGMATLLSELGHEETIGVCLDTGNSWLAGAEPIDYVKRFGNRIQHIHWKDLGPKWSEQRGAIYGCGMADIPLGDGLIGIPRIVSELRRAGFDGATTMEIAGRENVAESARRLKRWWEEAGATVENGAAAVVKN